MIVENKLHIDFTPQQLKDWESKILEDLKSPSLQELIKISQDGILVQPHYTKENSPVSFSIKPFNSNNDWKIQHLISINQPLDIANKKALEALNQGAESIVFCGKEINDLQVLLKGIMINIISIYFKIEDESTFTEEYIEYCNSNSISISELKGGIISHQNTQKPNNFHTLTPTGLKCIEILSLEKNTIPLLADLVNQFNNIIGLFNSQYSIETIVSKIYFKLSIGQDFFTEIAKVRTLRLMTNRVLEEYKCYSPIAINGFLDTAHWQLVDQENNLLRASSSTCAAVIGGYDELYIPPFKEGGERLSLNIHHLLKEEAYLNKVLDAASGSYFIEYLTHELIKKSWSKFQELEN